MLPDADTLDPSHQGVIPLNKHLSIAAQTATVLPNLKSSSLISLGQICDENCTIVLTKKKSIAVKDTNINIDVNNASILFTGTRNVKDGLYDIPINKTTLHTANFVQPELKGYNIEGFKNTLSSLRSQPKKNRITKSTRQDVNHMIS